MPPLQGKVCIKINALSNKHLPRQLLQNTRNYQKEQIIQYLFI